jgi:ribosomal protein S18 acetylase RimI-like enzyme
MMLTVIEVAHVQDLERVGLLQQELFMEDAGVHERQVDPTWVEREGEGDLRRLTDDVDSLLLVARAEDLVVGYLAGYLSMFGPTRHPGRFAVLRSLCVDRPHRRMGVGQQLTTAFLTWARDHGCVEAQVSSYVANGPAQAFYERSGFVPQSLSRVVQLDPR